MNKQLNLAVLALATTIFAGLLANTSPVKAEAYDDFSVELHSKTFLRVETGLNFTVALTTDNEVFTMGRNDKGQLGNDTLVDSNKAINITSFFSLPANYEITDIDAGDHHAVAVATDTVTQNQKIYLWGDNTYNQLGQSSVTAFEKKPKDMSASFVVGGVINKAVASEANTMIWTNANIVRMAGRNTYGVLGNNTVNASTTPVTPTFSGMPANAIVDVGLYANTAYALTGAGLVYVWGNNASRQVGNNSGSASVNVPTNITAQFGLTDPEKVVSVATGENHSVAVTSAGKIFFWGTVLNNSIAEALANNTVKATPFNVTSYFYNPTIGNSSPLFGPEYSGDDNYLLPYGVLAGSDSTFFIVDWVYDYDSVIERQNYNGYASVGKNSHNGINYLINWSNNEIVTEPNFLSHQYFGDATIESISFSKTNLIILNTEGDFTMFGSNEFGQMGLGFNSDPGVTEEYNTNYSYNVRSFEEYVYDYLPANLTAPLDNYFDGTPGRSDEYDAIYGYWNDNNYRTPGIVDYYFGDYFTDKEWELITPAQLTKMRSIFAEIFEDQVLYGWVPATNAELLTYVQNNLEDRYWLREDMEAMANYGSWELSWDDLVTLDAETIALLDANVEPRLNDFRAILANIIEFEQEFLQPFIDELTDLENEDPDLYDFVYEDEDDGFVWLDLYQYNVGQLIELEYDEDILAIFAAYESLSELEQLLLTEYYGWNYEHLYLEYYEYFADTYADALNDFEDNVQEEYWDWTWPLFENLEALETLLAGIEDLNSISYDLFTEMYGEGDEYYSYDMYEYWEYLNSILPYLQEGKPVFDQITDIEDLIQYDEDENAYVNLEDVSAILDMYEDFLSLSEDAQNLLDPEYVSWIYSLALEALANQVENELTDIYEIEDELGTDGLFVNLAAVNAAIELYENLPADALELLNEDAQAYYEYLKGLQAALTEALPVYELISDLPDVDNVVEADFQDILDAVNAYNDLSEDAQALLDGEYLRALLNQIAQRAIDNLPAEELTLNDENAVKLAREAYDLLTEEEQEALGEDYLLRLQAAEARIAELKQIGWAQILTTFGVLFLHVAAAAYFVFLKRKDLAKLTGIKILAK